MTKHNMENKMFVFTLDPHGEQITSIGQLFKEYWHLRKVQKCLLKHNYCGSKDFTGARNGLISECEEYLDVWTYDEDGEPVKDSEFINALQNLGFCQSDWLHVYTFKNIYVGDGKYLLIDYNIKLLGLLDLIGIITKHQQRPAQEAV